MYPPPYGTPTLRKSPSTAALVAFIISMVLQGVVIALMVLITMLAAMAFDSCGLDCSAQETWWLTLLGLVVAAAVSCMAALIAWFVNKRAALIASVLCWMLIVVWVGVIASGAPS